MPADPSGQPSAVGLLTQALSHLTAMLRGEIALAKAEARETTALVARAAGLAALGAVLAMVGLNALAGAAIAALVAAGLSETGAMLAVGLGLLVVAAIVVLVARAQVKRLVRTPRRITANLRRDAAAVTGESKDA